MVETQHDMTPRNSLSTFRVNTIKELQKANCLVNERLKTLEAMCNQLHKDNIAHKKENEELIATKSKPVSTAPKQSNVSVDEVYETDEDELATETEWILNKKRYAKKRKANSSPTINSPLKNKNKENVGINDTKTHRPPPIIINDVKDFNKFHVNPRNGGL
uniref:DNA-directed RNA polymerase subunit beta n=1 Tax=Zeugodacus cucurbitae TaxID=28588 RepID=A0A0A1XK28_ZEUCU